MDYPTRQQIEQYYEKFKDTEINFNKSVIQAMDLDVSRIVLKYKDGEKSCILYSSSMSSAKIIVFMADGVVGNLKEGSLVNLRYSFLDPKRKESANFIVPCHISNIVEYDDKKKLYFISLVFHYKSPEDLIVRFGRFLEIDVNVAKRNVVRISISPETLGWLNLETKMAVFMFNNIHCNSIVQDISYRALRLIVLNNTDLSANQEISITLKKNNGRNITLLGTCLRLEKIEEYQGVFSVIVALNMEVLPIEYKYMINDCLKRMGHNQVAN